MPSKTKKKAKLPTKVPPTSHPTVDDIIKLYSPAPSAKEVEINVTQEDIDNAKDDTSADWAETCPVARAAARAFGSPVRVTVNAGVDPDSWVQGPGMINRIAIKHKRGVFVYSLPKHVAKIVEKYDETDKMKPFKFSIAV